MGKHVLIQFDPGRASRGFDWLDRLLLFSDDFVRPFHQRDEDLGVPKLCPVLSQIRLSYASGTGTCATGIDRYFFSNEFAENFGQRRPANWNDRVSHRFAHQRYCFAEKKDLDFMTGFGKCIAMKERERRLGRII